MLAESPTCETIATNVDSVKAINANGKFVTEVQNNGYNICVKVEYTIKIKGAPVYWVMDEYDKVELEFVKPIKNITNRAECTNDQFDVFKIVVNALGGYLILEDGNAQGGTGKTYPMLLQAQLELLIASKTTKILILAVSHENITQIKNKCKDIGI
eukprot:11185541-Heterocapsa_arctica.AAC.1